MGVCVDVVEVGDIVSACVRVCVWGVCRKEKNRFACAACVDEGNMRNMGEDGGVDIGGLGGGILVVSFNTGGKKCWWGRQRASQIVFSALI